MFTTYIDVYVIWEVLREIVCQHKPGESDKMNLYDAQVWTIHIGSF